MPPNPKRRNDSDDDSGRYYSNQDIAILHDIVVLAQELLPKLPQRERIPTSALFNAHNAILPTVGLDPNHDKHYARILFKVGGVRSHGDLYEKFELVLRSMGIEIQHEEADNEDDPGESRRGDTFETLSHVTNRKRGSSRRNSESSVWDSGRTREVQGRRWSDSSLPHRETLLEFSPRSIHRATSSGMGCEADYMGVHSLDGMEPVRAWLATKLDPKSPALRNHSPVARSSVVEEHNTTRQLLHSATVGQIWPIENEADDGSGVQRRFTPGSTNMLPKSSSRALQQDQRLKHQTWSLWRMRTQQACEDSNNLILLANHKDRGVLLRQAFDNWQADLKKLQMQVETNRFFAHLEGRASRARDLYLLSKVFTHWAQASVEEVQRVSVARRHIVRTRLFDAWRDITVCNELEVKRFHLRKIFVLWVARSLENSLMISKTPSIYANNTLRHIFWNWLLKTVNLEERAFWGSDIDNLGLSDWQNNSRHRSQNNQLAESRHAHWTKRNAFQSWRGLGKATAQNTFYATSNHGTNTRRAFLRLLHRLFIVKSIARRVNESVRKLCGQKELQAWCHRRQQHKIASTFDQSKISREVLASWSLKLRFLALKSQLHNRLVLGVLYRWVLSERMRLIWRLSHQRTLHRISRKAQEIHRRAADRGAQTTSVAIQYDNKIVRGALRKWHSHHCRILLMDQQMVHRKMLSPLKSPIVSWLESVRRAAGLTQRYEDGQFYFLAKKSITAWRRSVETSRSEQRRLAYTVLRRSHKRRVAKQFFSTWVDNAASISALSERAIHLHHDKANVVGMEILDLWRASNTDVSQMAAAQSKISNRKSFHILKKQCEELQKLQTKAQNYSEDCVATFCIRAWTRTSLRLKSQLHLATKFHRKSRKKVIWLMILYWHQLSTSHAQFKLEESQTGGHRIQKEIVVLKSKDGWSDIGEGGANESEFTKTISPTHTPLMPGYLRTPMRRSRDIRLAKKSFTTTPSSPLPQSAKRQLRSLPSSRALLFGRFSRSRKSDIDISDAESGDEW